MIKLTGYIDVPDDRLQDIKAALPEHIKLSRAETGNIRFSIKPCPDTKGRFIVEETFTDQAAFDFHQTRTAASRWAIISKDIPRKYRHINRPTA